MRASIIIRVKNEQKWLGATLSALSRQTEKNFEVIIVDDHSTDNTLNILTSFSRKLIIKKFHLEPGKFTYPHACNVGAKMASGDYFVYLSGHSVPINTLWLENGLRNFSDKRVAGIYGGVFALPDASIWEKIYYGLGSLRRRKIDRRARIGVLGNTNSIIRRDLWQSHPFDERLVDGAEDTAWAKFYLEKGYTVVRDPKFSVYHSHGLGLIQFIKQVNNWHRIARLVQKY